jgi:hypothetical protein
MNDRDIFYDTAKLSRHEQEVVLRKAHSICERWWFDKLDCLESFARQQVKGISFEDAMGHFVEGALMNVIHRRQILAFVVFSTICRKQKTRTVGARN